MILRQTAMAAARVIHAYRTTQKTAYESAVETLVQYIAQEGYTVGSKKEDSDVFQLAGFNIWETQGADTLVLDGKAVKAAGFTPESQPGWYKPKKGSTTINVK